MDNATRTARMLADFERRLRAAERGSQMSRATVETPSGETLVIADAAERGIAAEGLAIGASDAAAAAQAAATVAKEAADAAASRAEEIDALVVDLNADVGTLNTEVDGIPAQISTAKAEAVANGQTYTQARGTDLVTNGSGFMKNATNFDNFFTFNGTDAPTGASGSFVDKSTAGGARMIDEVIPYDSSKPYRFAFQMRQTVPGMAAATAYGFVAPIDADGFTVDPNTYIYIAGTQTTLAQPLNPGDTVIRLTSAANWFGSAAKPAGSETYKRAIQFWDYVDGSGKAWAPYTYTRNVLGSNSWADGAVDTVANTITLNAAYNGPARPAGTPVSNTTSGGSYVYMPSLTNGPVPEAWTKFADTLKPKVFPPSSQAVASTGSATWDSGLPAATAKIKVGWLLNYGAAGGRHAVAAVSFSDASAANFAANNIYADQIVSDQILTRHVKAGEILASHMQAGTITAASGVIGSLDASKITTGKITAAQMQTGTITAASGVIGSLSAATIVTGALAAGTRVIAGPESGTHAELTDNGFLAYSEDTVDGVPNLSVKIGTGDNDLFALSDANGIPKASISEDGVASFAKVFSTSDPEVLGTPLLGNFGTFESPTQQAESNPGILDALPRGIVGFGSHQEAAALTTTQGMFELAFKAEPGRSYRVTYGGNTINTPITANEANSGVYVQVQRPTFTADGSGIAATPTISSGALTLGYSYVLNSSAAARNHTIPARSWTLRCNPEGTAAGGELNAGVNKLFIVAVPYGSMTFNSQEWITLTVEDIGPDVPNNKLNNSSTSAAPQAAQTSTKTYTTTWTSTSSATYQGGGGKRSDTSDVVQGYNSYNGDGKGLWIFPSMTAALTGATISKIEVYAYANHWYYNGGGTARIHLHGYTSAPASSPTMSYAVQSTSWPKPGGRWITLPASTHSSFKSGNWRGFGMGPAGSTSLTYYGRFNGGTAAKIRITYTK